ncbi:MAG: PEP/pyruvate-binding domain-containing protein, partial [Thermovirgaceae bacterium]|nr:PEP/pyruvate-binding domain-containing protein [Thermovirgaceae bacterium]
MRLFIPFEAFVEGDKTISGGKAWSLSLLAKTGFDIPEGAVLSVEAYRTYVDSTGIGERIMLEINRKPFESMRWEEMWDAALRIRNLFLKTPIPADLYEEIAHQIENIFREDAVAVRSSAPGEDSGGASFAGLHESFLNIKGTENILEHIRLVWASLWSDAALLYRRELGLDVSRSSMAVVIQKLAAGDRSGVVFSRNPMDNTTSIVEAVWGLNQGLVDGTVSPDRWIIDRKTEKIRDHAPAEREIAVRPSLKGTRLE